MLLEVTVEKAQHEEAVWLISVSGELDFRSSPRFTRAFQDVAPPGGDDVVLDLSELGFLDSSGLAAVLDLYARLERAGARLAVVASRASITRVFSATGLDRLLGVAATRERAIAVLRQAAGEGREAVVARSHP